MSSKQNLAMHLFICLTAAFGTYLNGSVSAFTGNDSAAHNTVRNIARARVVDGATWEELLDSKTIDVLSSLRDRYKNRAVFDTTTIVFFEICYQYELCVTSLPSAFWEFARELGHRYRSYCRIVTSPSTFQRLNVNSPANVAITMRNQLTVSNDRDSTEALAARLFLTQQQFVNMKDSLFYLCLTDPVAAKHVASLVFESQPELYPAFGPSDDYYGLIVALAELNGVDVDRYDVTGPKESREYKLFSKLGAD